MKGANRYIIYIIIILILAGGLALFLLQDEAITFLNEKTKVPIAELPTKVASSSIKDALDIGLLTAPKFISLKNNVVKFDFDNICQTPVGRTLTVATTSEGELATSSQIINCSLGNGLLFPVPVKKN